VIDKDRPTAEWIAAIRRRYPCETEVDRVLTRKLTRRSSGRYAPLALATLCRSLESLLRAHLDDAFEISGAKWLSGGASKLQMVFDLTRRESGVQRTTPLVLRMETPESVVESSRLREFQLLEAIQGAIPAPRPLWVDARGEHLPYPGLVYTWAPGVTKPTGASSGVTGVGIGFGPELRSVLAGQFVEHLSTLHTLDWRAAKLDAFDVPDTATRAVEWQINWWERVWEEDSHEEVPLLRVAAAWLRENMPPVDRLSIVHGDYRSGNFLFTEHDQRISAWLDWELGHLGDRHEDFGWMLSGFNRQIAEDGTSLVCGLLSEQALFEAYEKASGLSLDLERLAYYRIFNAFKAAVIPTATAYRVARGGKTHQDVLAAWFQGIGYPVLGDLRNLLETVA
jgi:aminoglycoside phosphotransferase (APT) family kinase protein